MSDPTPDKRSRPRRRYGFLSALIAVVLTVVIAATIFFKSGLPAYQLGKYVNNTYLAGTPYHFNCSGIGGDLVNDVTLFNPSLRYDGPEGSFEVFRARRLSMNYSLVQVLRLKMIVSNLEIDKPSIIVRRGADGAYLLPIPKQKAASEKAPSSFAPEVAIERFAVDDLRFSYNDGDLEVGGQDVSIEGSFHLEGSNGSVAIERAGGHLSHPDLPVNSLSVEAEFTNFADFRFKNIALRLDQSFVLASGRFDTRDGRLRQAQLIFNPLDLSEVAAFGGLGDLHGELGGSVSAEGLLADSLRVRGSVTGKALGYVLNNLSFRGDIGPDEIVLSQVRGGFFGAHVDGSLRFDPHDGSFGYHGQCESVDLSEGIVPGSDLPNSDLNGRIDIDYVSALGDYNISGELRESMFMDFGFRSARARLTWNDNTGLRLHSVDAAGDDFRIRGSGTLDTEEVAEMIVRISGDSLDYIMDYLSLPRVGGSTDLSGRVAGPLDDLQINLNGTARNMTYLFAGIDSCQVRADARGVGGDAASATIAVAGDSVSVYGRRFSDPHLLIEVSPDDVFVKDLSFTRGDTLLTMDFGVEVAGERTDIDLRHAVVQTPQTSWHTPHATHIVVQPHSTYIDSLILGSNGHRLGLSGTYAPDIAQTDLELWGSNLELSILREALALPFRVEGIGSFRSSLVGDNTHPRIELVARISRGAVDSLRFDSFRFEGGFDDEGYRIDHVFVRSGTDSITGSGRWQFPDSPIRIASDGYDSGRALRAPIAARLESHRFALESALRAAHQKPFWHGSFSGTLDIGGSAGDPTLDFTGLLVARPEEKYQLPDITTEFSYREGVLRIARISFDDGSTSLSIEGEVPVMLSINQGARLREEAAVRIDARLVSKNLTSAAPYFRQVNEAAGRLSSELKISGTAGSPRYQGSVNLEQGLLQLAGMKERYRDIKATVQLDQRRLELTSLSGAVGKKGKFSGTGELTFEGFKPASYRLELDVNDARIESIDDIVVTQDGHLVVASEKFGDQTVPEISGHVKVKEAWIYKSFTSSEAGQAGPSLPTDTPSWLCNLDIDAPNNVWVKNPDLSMELGGRVLLRRDQRGLYLRGELEVLRGSYNLYNNKFRITEGRFDFSRGTTLRPEIFLSAYTPHRVPGQDERRIFLTLNWPTDKPEPQLSLSYDLPGYSEPDLWRMLGGQVIAGEGAMTAGGQWDAAGTAQNIASNYLERVLNARMADMTIDIESRLADGGSGAGVDRELSVAIGRYLSEDLYLKYRQGLSVTSERQVDIEYRISNLVLLRSEIIQYSNKGLAGKDRPGTDEINFDIKFRWEY